MEKKAKASFVKAKAHGGGSLMSLHYKGIMTIIPAIVTAIFMGAFWKRFTAIAACVSMVVGSMATLITNIYPDWILHLSRFVGGPENGIYIYMRSLFGMTVTAVIGVVVTCFTRPRDPAEITGLTISTLDAAMRKYKGGKPNHKVGKKARRLIAEIDEEIPFEQISVSLAVMELMKAEEGDMIYMEDSRWYLGGLRSVHVKAAPPHADSEEIVRMSKETYAEGYFLEGRLVTLEKIF